MKVYLVRHGHSVQAHAALVDSDRYLSADGRRELRKVGGWLREEKVEFDLVLTSPLVRAVQTAELLADAVDYLGVVESLSSLAPGCSPQLAADAITKHAVNVAVIGHEPTISALGALLLGQPSFQPFRPGQIILIEQGTPVWRMNPSATGVEPQF